jgi:O-methyltransferase
MSWVGIQKIRSFAHQLRRAVPLARNGQIENPIEFSEDDIEIIDYVISERLTMVSRQRLIATIQACKYVAENHIEGAFVECGVWRGGNSIAAKLIFEKLGSQRDFYLYDTFAGMTPPSKKDFSLKDRKPAEGRYLKNVRGDHNEWCYASRQSVMENFIRAGIKLDNVRFIEGDVLETLLIGSNLPNRIAVLRLDTDWYDSTKKELEILYPRLSERGVLLIDDYGHWGGARDAVDEFFKSPNVRRPLLQYTDYTGRMGVK